VDEIVRMVPKEELQFLLGDQGEADNVHKVKDGGLLGR